MTATINDDTFGYASAAPIYRAAGWTQIIPLPEGRKTPPPSGYTGSHATPASQQTIDYWSRTQPDANIGIVIPDGVIVLDIDTATDHRRKADGITGIHELERTLGPLPETWSSTAHGADSPARHLFYRVPTGLLWRGGAISGVDILQPAHRYSVVWPSIHPSGEQYTWYEPDGSTAGHIPTVDDLPMLPDSWVDHLKKPARPHSERTLNFTTMPADTNGMCKAIRTFLDTVAGNPAAKGSRHDTMLEAVWALIRFKEEGHRGADEAIRVLRPMFVTAVAADREGGEEEAAREFDRLVAGARAQNHDMQGAIDPCDHTPGMDTRISDAELAQIEQYANTPQNPQNKTTDAWDTPTQSFPQASSKTAVEAAQASPSWQTQQAPAEQSQQPTPQGSWGAIDLSAWADGNPNPAPDLLIRTDGIGLLYRGRINDMHGEPESGKSLLAQYATAESLINNMICAYVDFEDNAGSILQRLRLMGVPDDTILDQTRFTYHNPSGNPLDPANLDQFQQIIDADNDLIVVDGLNNMLSGMGLDQDKATDIATLYTKVLKPMSAYGAAVLLVDHVVKNRDGQGRFAAGSIQKLAQIDGASYYVYPSRPLGRGMRGEITIKLAKDRNGYLGEHCAPPNNKNDRLREAARISVDSTNPERMLITVGKPTNLPINGEPADTKPTWIMERVCEVLKRDGGWSGVNKVYMWLKDDKVGARKSTVSEALEELRAAGHVELRSGPRGSNEYIYRSSYWERDDPESSNYQPRITDEEIQAINGEGDDDEDDF